MLSRWSYGGVTAGLRRSYGGNWPFCGPVGLARETARASLAPVRQVVAAADVMYKDARPKIPEGCNSKLAALLDRVKAMSFFSFLVFCSCCKAKANHEGNFGFVESNRTGIKLDD